MTWSQWFVTPTLTSLFFLLGVLTLYWFITNQIISLLKRQGRRPDVDKVRSNVGIIYMVIFLIVVQLRVGATTNSWVFTNFQIFSIVFVSYFLMLEIHVWKMLLAILFFMVLNQTLDIGLAWIFAVFYMSFFYSMKVVRRHKKNRWLNYASYTISTFIYSAVLWGIVGMRFNLERSTILWELLSSLVILAVMYVYVDSLMASANTLAQLTYTTNYDELTHVKNYFAFKNELNDVFEKSRTHNQPLTLMLFDIDHFKHVNDSYGHLTGDYVLSHAAQLISEQLQKIDPDLVLYRTGGEEFTIVFAGYTADEAREAITGIAQTVRESRFHHNDKDIDISISVGVTQMLSSDDSQVAVYKRADDNLYYSKQHGRDQVTFG